MKMEFPVATQVAGTVEKLLIKTGELVSCGQTLAYVRPSGS
jgi:biotin carboxyl carrier protein